MLKWFNAACLIVCSFIYTTAIPSLNIPIMITCSIFEVIFGYFFLKDIFDV